jgi:hypothetical protein
MDACLFILLNFWIGFFSDMVLNFLSTARGSKIFNSQIIKSLRPYFKKRSVLQAAIDAGLTVIIVLIIVMFTSSLILGFSTPNNIKQLVFFIPLAFVYGWIADVIIRDYKVFGTDLEKYYSEAGAGLWGGGAIVFTVILSYIKEKFLLQYL